jgi:hypothetical protein
MRAGPRTDYVRCVFHAWQSVDGAPWIEFGYFQPGVPALEIVRLGLTFRVDVTLERAKEITQELYDTFEGLRCVHDGRLGRRPGYSLEESPCTFTLVSPDDGPRWLGIQYYVGGLANLDVQSLGLTFRGDVTPERAEEIAQTLRATFKELRCTRYNPDFHHY